MFYSICRVCQGTIYATPTKCGFTLFNRTKNYKLRYKKYHPQFQIVQFYFCNNYVIIFLSGNGPFTNRAKLYLFSQNRVGHVIPPRSGTENCNLMPCIILPGNKELPPHPRSKKLLVIQFWSNRHASVGCDRKKNRITYWVFSNQLLLILTVIIVFFKNSFHNGTSLTGS